MLTIDPENSLLLVIDFQSRLMPVIHEGENAVRNAGRLIEAARLFSIPVLFTEQNPKGLGSTVPELAIGDAPVFSKLCFDACREDGFLDGIEPDRDLVVVGCEAHVCVLQTVLGLLAAGHNVFVAADAIGSRASANREAAIRRMERHGAEIVTTEMVVFEWAGTSENPLFRRASALIR